MAGAELSVVISVVITCYNYGNYLAGCIQSVLDQTFRSYEIIVVNDGSTDNTDEVMRRFTGNVRIRYIKQANGGQAIAKNTGIRNSIGKYIAFLDADDQWDIQKLAKQFPLFYRESVGVVFSRARYIDDAGRELDFQLSGKYLLPRKGRVTDFLLIDNFIPFSSSVVKREVFECCGVFDESLKMGIDWDLWLRISTQYEFDFVDEPLLIYRMGHAGQMSKNAEERHRCSDRILRRFVKQFPECINKKLLRQAWAYTYLNRAAYHSDGSVREAVKYYYRAFLQWPFSLKPVVGVLKIARNKVL